MRWVAGRHGRPSHERYQPVGGRRLESTSQAGAVWTVGWEVGDVQQVSGAGVDITTVGHCYAHRTQRAAGVEAAQASRWRELTEWPGSYLTIVRSGARTVVIPDLAGLHSVYYVEQTGQAQGDRGVWWASAALPLARLIGADVDPVALAADLAFAQPDLLVDASLFAGVRMVPAGHLLRLEPGGGVVVQRLEPAGEPLELDQAAGRLRGALLSAVSGRTRTHAAVSSDFSGGLDSSTLACIAAGQAQRGEPVRGYTFTHSLLRNDDLEYAREACCDGVPGLAWRTVAGDEEALYYSGLEDPLALPLTDTPTSYTVTAGMKRAVLEQAALFGSSVHLVGAAGDVVVGAGPEYLSGLLAARRWSSAYHHAVGHARMRQVAPWRLLAQAWPASRSTLAGDLMKAAAQLRQPADEWIPQAAKPFSWCTPLATTDWLAEAVRGQLAERLEESSGRHPRWCLERWSSWQQVRAVARDVTGLRESTYHQYKIDVAAPFLDNQVLRTALAVPGEQRGTPAVYKPLLATAMAPTDLVSSEILNRRTKGTFNGLVYAGIRVHAGVLWDLLGEHSRVAELGLSHLGGYPVLVQVVDRVLRGQSAPLGAFHRLAAVEVWLRQVAASNRCQWWEVSAAVEVA